MSKAIKITIILDQENFPPYSEEICRDLLGSHHCLGIYTSFSQERVTFEEIESEPIKYLQDMSFTDFDKIFGEDNFVWQFKADMIASFKSLHGFMSTISKIGHFKSYPIAKEMGYDVEFTLPIKR